MKIKILTLFPDSFAGFLSNSIIGRARSTGVVKVEIVNLRNFAKNSYGSVDDKPYGGGVGMVLRVDVVAAAIMKHRTPRTKVILLTPQGRTINQALVRELSQEKELLLIAGHYEGFDERIRTYVDLELSIGDYVLTGGELPAAVITDAIVRLLPGVLGKDESSVDESFSADTLEYPQYTRPEEYEGKSVPAVLLSGHHEEIRKWRAAESQQRTKDRRPDLTQ